MTEGPMGALFEALLSESSIIESPNEWITQLSAVFVDEEATRMYRSKHGARARDDNKTRLKMLAGKILAHLQNIAQAHELQLLVPEWLALVSVLNQKRARAEAAYEQDKENAELRAQVAAMKQEHAANRQARKADSSRFVDDEAEEANEGDDGEDNADEAKEDEKEESAGAPQSLGIAPMPPRSRSLRLPQRQRRRQRVDELRRATPAAATTTTATTTTATATTTAAATTQQTEQQLRQIQQQLQQTQQETQRQLQQQMQQFQEQMLRQMQQLTVAEKPQAAVPMQDETIISWEDEQREGQR